MKHRELVKLLEANGWYIKRNSGNHDIYGWKKDRTYSEASRD